MTVEKNDVEISPLFHWHKKFRLVSFNGEEELYIRLVGDSELNRARVYALRRSAELRNKLRNLNSDERLAFIENKEVLNKVQLIQFILVFSMRELMQEATQNISLAYPKEPKSTASLEEQEKYQKDIDEYPTKKEELTRQYLDTRLTKIKESLEEMDEARLYNEYEKIVVNEMCEQEMLKAFSDFCTYSGIYKDIEFKERYFSSLDEFQNLPSKIKDSFLVAYRELELSAEDLKKLQGVTP